MSETKTIQVDEEQLIRLYAAAPALLAACKKLEWSDRDSFHALRCPVCLGLKSIDHCEDCELKAAIALAEKKD